MATKTNKKRVTKKNNKVTSKPFRMIIDPKMPVSAELLMEYGLLDNYKGAVVYTEFINASTNMSTNENGTSIETKPKSVGFFRRLWNKMFAA